MNNILVIEDERKVSAMIQQGLAEDYQSVDVAETPNAARNLINKKKYDLLILDVMLPEMSGFDFARELRAKGEKSLILMLTALSTTNDKINGLDSGADDYLTKPFEFDELKARIRALLRRKNDSTSILENGELTMNLITRTVEREGKNIELTTKEFSLLEFLMRNRDKVIDRNTIARHVWATDFDPESNVIDVYINHLRKKIDNGFQKKMLKTVIGQGYVLGHI